MKSAHGALRFGKDFPSSQTSLVRFGKKTDTTLRERLWLWQKDITPYESLVFVCVFFLQKDTDYTRGKSCVWEKKTLKLVEVLGLGKKTLKLGESLGFGQKDTKTRGKSWVWAKKHYTRGKSWVWAKRH